MKTAQLPKIKVSRTLRLGNYSMHESHYHDDYELYYLEEGRSRLFLDNKIYTLREGDLALIPRGMIHRVTSIKNISHTRVVAMIPYDFIVSVLESLGAEDKDEYLSAKVISIPDSKIHEFQELIDNILFEEEHNDNISGMMIESYIRILLLTMFRYYQLENETALKSPNTTDEIIQLMARFISKNYQKNITLNMAAEMANLSPTYFSKKFKQKTGFGFKDYLVKVRLMEAAKMLKNSDKSVTEVALECGFNDSNYFGTMFKKEFSIPPAKFKRTSKLI